jgi:ArsR family transcriptional regulator, virulence genes transcriptional regulator
LITDPQDEKVAEIFRLQADLCKTLADPKRLMIIHILRDKSCSVNELATSLGLKQSNTSQHLAVLRKAGVVSTQRAGNEVHYRLAIPRIASACDMVRQIIAEELQRNQALREVIQGSR